MLRSFLLATALGLPTLGLAQSAPRYYLGAGVSVLTDNPFHSGSYHSVTPVGPALTGGLQLGQRIALQASPSLLWGSSSDSYSSYQPVNSNVTSISTSSYAYRVRIFNLPVLLRQTFTNPESRLRLDGLLGLTLLHSGYHSTHSSVTNGLVDYSYDDDDSANRLFLSLGPGLRYGLSRQLELVASAPIGFVLTDGYGSFNDRLLLNVLAGVHFTFGAQ